MGPQYYGHKMGVQSRTMTSPSTITDRLDVFTYPTTDPTITALGCFVTGPIAIAGIVDG